MLCTPFIINPLLSSPPSPQLPKFFQMGTVVEGSAEFHSARMAKKERKRTLAEEILHDPSIAQYRRGVVFCA